MPTVDVFDLDNKKVGELELSEAVFGAPVNETLIYEYVRMQMARRRRGTHKTKGRGEIRGGGRKPFKQKGTGRARQGSSRSPNHVGGGTVHGPQPRSYAFEMPKRAKRGAIRSALSMKLGEKKLIIVDHFKLDEAKTKTAAAILRERFGLRAALIVDAEKHGESALSVRNLPHFKLLASAGLNVRDVLKHDTLILTRDAVEKVQERLA